MAAAQHEQDLSFSVAEQSAFSLDLKHNERQLVLKSGANSNTKDPFTSSAEIEEEEEDDKHGKHLKHLKSNHSSTNYLFARMQDIFQHTRYLPYSKYFSNFLSFQSLNSTHIILQVFRI